MKTADIWEDCLEYTPDIPGNSEWYSQKNIYTYITDILNFFANFRYVIIMANCSTY